MTSPHPQTSGVVGPILKVTLIRCNIGYLREARQRPGVSLGKAELFATHRVINEKWETKLNTEMTCVQSGLVFSVP